VTQPRLAACVLRVQRRLVEKRFIELALRIAGLATEIRRRSDAGKLTAEYSAADADPCAPAPHLA
jgi:hypothetical protein